MEDSRASITLVGHLAGDYLGGAERSLLDILAAIDRRAYRLSCVLPAHNEAYSQAVARRTESLDVFPYSWWNVTRPPDPAVVASFEEVFRRQRTDVVHVNTITLQEPLIAARRLGVPGIVHARELIIDDEILAEVLGGTSAEIVAAVRARADFIIANSDATHRLYGRCDRSFRLYNSVDIDRFDLATRLTPGKLVVGMIGNNQPRKGIEGLGHLAVRAVDTHPELEFVAVGPLNEHTERFTGVPNLRFVDSVAEPIEALQQVDVVVSLPLVAESFGRTILEAMAARRPVIAYDRGGVRELVRDGVDGFLVPYLDLDRVLTHLAMLAGDAGLVVEMGCRGRERAASLFSSASFAVQLDSIYRQVIAAYVAN